MLQKREQERAKPPALMLQMLNPILFDEAAEELLGQVLGIGARLPIAAHISVNWAPIRTTQTIQRSKRLGGISIPGSKHYTPMRRRKSCARRFRMMVGVAYGFPRRQCIFVSNALYHREDKCANECIGRSPTLFTIGFPPSREYPSLVKRHHRIPMICPSLASVLDMAILSLHEQLIKLPRCA